MNNIRKILILLMMVLIIGTSFVTAGENNANDVEKIPYEDERSNATENDLEKVLVGPTLDDNVFESNINGEEYKGLCLNYTEYGPIEPTYYNSSNNTDHIDQRIKNIVTKYYRYDNDPNTNFLMTIAIAKIVYNYQDGVLEDWFDFTSEERNLFDMMLNDHMGVSGNTYTDAEGNVFTFTFKFLTTNNKINSQTLQDLLMFRYDISDAPDNNITEPNTNNTTEKPGNNITEDPAINNTSSINPENPNGNNNEKNNIVKDISDAINMKKAGIPIVTILIVLLSSLGLIYRKK